ncbi:TetR family transcriptional regulator [uncultured Deefgea sp.]|uniref:TetR family transcriptional regulator n=1 Tax=uncultured Deefgea sp. TaxID=1304914 RepID=UPI0026233711|nr:TetR family transcriptional regulator [uncultured Deefgea sp.]
MARKTKADAQKTRDAILDAAEQVFFKQGIAHTTMADIANAAQVSRGAVYGHYPNKIDVCKAMSERMLAHAAMQFTPSSSDALEALVQTGMYYLNLFNQSGSIQTVISILYYRCERSADNMPLIRHRDLITKRSMHYSLRLLRRAVAQQVLPATLDLRLSNLYLHTVFDGLYDLLQDFYPERPNAAASDCERLLRSAVHSLKNAPHLHRSAD